MSTFILTWNPDSWVAGDGWLDECAGTATPETPVPGDWSVGGRRGGIMVGDRALLLRQRRDRGLVASGEFTSEVVEGPHWDGSARSANNAAVDFDHVVAVDERLPVEILKSAVPEVIWDRLQGSGVRVPDAVEARLLQLWADHVGDQDSGIYPDDVPPTYVEGAMRSVKVNRYERNPAARAACLRHHGTGCVVCGFNFEQIYGARGARGIHVHHLRELSTIGNDYQVDPVHDLIPVCPNCHAMLHSQRPALAPEDVRRMLVGRPGRH